MAGGFGFTGTQNGTTKKQRSTLRVLIQTLLTSVPVVDHGDCIGADEELHRLLVKFHPNVFIRIHPPKDKKKRAFCDTKHKGKNAIWLAPPKEYLDRNKDIVNNTNALVACPYGFTEEKRSGTWSTIRYARKQKKNIHIIFPDGSMRIETPLFVAEYGPPVSLRKIK